MGRQLTGIRTRIDRIEAARNRSGDHTAYAGEYQMLRRRKAYLLDAARNQRSVVRVSDRAGDLPFVLGEWVFTPVSRRAPGMVGTKP